jgi:ABC-type polysaccharide/polyol phosphate export permease
MDGQLSLSLDRGSKVALWDIIQGFLNWRLWAYLGLHDIRQRYRRSLFGPLWLALGLGATILGIGLLYSQILKTNLGSFIPYLALSLLIWNFLAGILTESTMMFQSNAGLITSVRVPYTSFALRGLIRNLIVAAHCAVPVIIAFVFFKFSVHPIALLSLIGIALVLANMYWISLLLGMICLRFRDIAQIVIYTTQLAMFITPIIWTTDQVRPGSPYVELNPFYHLINVIRAPIFYNRFPIDSIVFCLGMLVVGLVLTAFVFTTYRRNVAFWL